MTESLNEPVDHLACNELVELVTAFLEGALDPATERRVVDHISLCDGCDLYVDQIRQTTDVLAGLSGGQPLSPADRDRLRAAFRDSSG
ncbi:anti-sigma factor family protein [Jiangella alba]|uniref:Putative zinc-finger n=1 Tax=Jiangella alba TaxID=561176 RepID=A0A1H5PAU0_9ACTN|nr:zf-HC2 domain-containing protein [Jiangella alba]SEF10724.1 Putative zinc-finger [Jiangella alba]